MKALAFTVPAVVLLAASFAVPSGCTGQKPVCQSTVSGSLDIVSLRSQIFHNRRSLRVWLPPGYSSTAQATRRYPVLYLLDGASAFDRCTAYMHEELGADETLTRMISDGQIPPIIAVGLDNGSDSAGFSADGEYADHEAARSQEYLPYPDPLSPNVRSVHGDLFPAFFEREVLPAIANRYRTLAGPQNTAVWGDSYAGVAALNLAITRPDLVGSIIAESPALQAGNGQLLRDTVSLVVASRRIALGVGTAEIFSGAPNAAAINAAIVQQMKSLAANLKQASFAAPSVQLTITEGAGHSAIDFGKRLPTELLFIYGDADQRTTPPR